MDNNTSRVLIVDDMLANRIILSSLLASKGVTSDQVESGKECIELCKENDYDLILLDHRMPELDGVDTLTALKEIFAQKKKTVPVICHTTEEGRQNINLYKAAGFADVLIKPIDLRQLSEILLTYLADNDEEIKEEHEKDLKEEEEKKEIHLQDELQAIPLWLKNTAHIDIVQGILNCETAEDYMDALTVFAASIDRKIDEILTFYEKSDWSMYTLRVHSLKSVSSLIGAKKLCELAAELELAGKSAKYNKIIENNRYLIEEYKSFLTLLDPIIEKKEQKEPKKEEKKADVNPPEEAKPTVLFIEGTSSISNKGLSQSLKKANFEVIVCEADPGKIIAHRDKANIIIYYPGDDDKSRITIIMNHLGEMCQDDNKTLCLVGESYDLEFALSCEGSGRVIKTYIRPVDAEKFVQDIQEYSLIQDRFHEKKSIFIVDDDTDFLRIMENWLSPSYSIYSFSSGADVLKGLETFKPDLILLDYEMPEMNGFELMKIIKTTPNQKEIPIIFLTGKNDRDHVFRILENKPDGYLLKSSSKENLIDAIARFFAESAFKASLEV